MNKTSVVDNEVKQEVDIPFNFEWVCNARADELESNQTLYPETKCILPHLIQLTKLGLLTASSQPGSTIHTLRGFLPNQKAYVAGIMKTDHWEKLKRELSQLICFFTENGDRANVALSADSNLKYATFYWGGRMYDSFPETVGIPSSKMTSGKLTYIQIASQTWGDDRLFWQHLIKSLERIHERQQRRDTIKCRETFAIHSMIESVCWFLSVSDLIALRWTHKKFHKALTLFWNYLLPKRLQKNLAKLSPEGEERLTAFLDDPEVWEALREHKGRLCGIGLLLALVNEHVNYDTNEYCINFTYIHNNPIEEEMHETKWGLQEYEEKTRPTIVKLLLKDESKTTRIRHLTIRGDFTSKVQTITDGSKDNHVSYIRYSSNIPTLFSRDNGFNRVDQMAVFPTILRGLCWLKSEFRIMDMFAINPKRDPDIDKVTRESAHFDMTGVSFDGKRLEIPNMRGFYERVATMQHKFSDEINPKEQIWAAGQESSLLCEMGFHVHRSEEWLGPQLKTKIYYWTGHVMKSPENQYKGEERESNKRNINEMLTEWFKRTPAVHCTPPSERIGAPLPKRRRLL